MRRTVRLARARRAPCGTFNVRRRQIPVKPAVGRWTLQVDQQPSYSAEPVSVFVRLAITVSRELKPTR